MEDDNSGGRRENESKGGLVKRALVGTGAVIGTHLLTCPLHLTLALGAVGFSVTPPKYLVNAHEYLVDSVTPAVAYFRGDDKDYSRLPPFRFNPRTRELIPVNPNRGYAHDIVDYGGSGLAGLTLLGLGFLSYRRHRRRRSELVHSNEA